MRITGLKAMEPRDSAGQSLVRVETDSGLFGIGEAGVAGPASEPTCSGWSACSSAPTR